MSFPPTLQAKNNSMEKTTIINNLTKQQKMKKSILLIGFAVLSFAACSDKSSELNGDEKVMDIKAISGRVQKGPFINGTPVRVIELNSDLQQTGKSFETQVSDDKGTFELKNIGLISQYVELQASGYYFNEVTGNVSESQLTLRALTDLNSGATPNINILTTLEYGRVEYLISNGVSFDKAKQQAQAEVLGIFSIGQPGIGNSEELSIVGGSAGDAALLAVSSILQGNLSTGGVSQLVADISSDIRTDGKLDNIKLGSKLIGGAMVIDAGKIRENITVRYKKLGSEISVPEFRSIVKNFVDNTDFEYETSLEYPQDGKYGKNLLAITDTGCMYGCYSVAVNVPEGVSLAVRISSPLYPWDSWLLNSSADENHSTYSEADKSWFFEYSGPCAFDIDVWLRKVYKDVICDQQGVEVFREFENNKVKIEVFENGVLTMTKDLTILQEETCTEDFLHDSKGDIY